MLKFKRLELFSRLDKTAYSCLESATVLCKLRGNPYVELAHVVNQLLQTEDSDIPLILSFFDLDAGRLSADCVKALDRLPRGAPAITDFASGIEIMVKEAFMAASLIYHSPQVRTAHLLLALRQHDDLSRQLLTISPEFIKLKGDELQQKLPQIIAESREQVMALSSAAGKTAGAAGASAAAAGAATGQPAAMLSPAAMGQGEALSLYTQDLTEQARKGEIDDIVGRDAEIRKVMDVLLRRRQNNPILTGEAGVGKTAVVEGFALRLARNEVPKALQGTRLLSLDLGLLQAGASMKGEFENRLRQVLEEVQTSDTPIILFIDEAHTLIGAGGAAGQNDAANLLKPALARGKLRCIAATTWQEYIKYFEKDPALSRRFENILVGEPDFAQACTMLRALKGMLERHHKVQILDEAVQAAVKLSSRYIPARQLPDKAVSVLDTACARVALSQNAEPAELESLRHSLRDSEHELEILQQEEQEGLDHRKAIAQLQEKIASVHSELTSEQQRWEASQKVWQRYQEVLSAVHAASSSSQAETEEPADKDKLQQELQQVRSEFNALQGDRPLLSVQVDEQAVAAVIAGWTGIPLGRMVRNEVTSVLGLQQALQKRVIGQDHALALLSRRVLTSRAQLNDPERPVAVLMLAGPSGTGKTETAHALAEEIYGTDRNLITVNMSEFQEAHTVSTLKGAPPGYVGYGEGGVLTEAVRRHPYSVVLLDEIEKAHKDVHEMFFQIFDKGQMEDGAGRLVNFRNCIILLTTNVGDEDILQACQDEEHLPDPELMAKELQPALRRVFPAALLGRLNVIAYYPLFKGALQRIVQLKLDKVVRRVQEHYGAELYFTEAFTEEIIARCDNIASGARLIDGVINNDVLPALSQMFLQQVLDGRTLTSVQADSREHEFVFDCKSVPSAQEAPAAQSEQIQEETP